MRYITALTFVMLLTAATARAQAWREIKPIESSVEDVKRLLGDKVRCNFGECEYKIPNGGTLYVSVSIVACKDVREGRAWNVPLGTVINIQVYNPGNNLLISDLKLDESKLISVDPGDQLGIEIWESAELGIRINADKDKRIADLIYYPASKYDKILCPSTSTSKPSPHVNDPQP